MSGPIVRKYGFPNFEKIFGEREPQHGVEEGEVSPAESQASGSKTKKTPAAKAPGKPAAKTPRKKG
ncbi:MAG TPA: hypothetical protein VGZ22_25235 [Isosphaeraceae bacterium]|jgi:hypothetical protein|nr:hypothetical protein [Isosphaeraceae bacterium]